MALSLDDLSDFPLKDIPPQGFFNGLSLTNDHDLIRSNEKVHLVPWPQTIPAVKSEGQLFSFDGDPSGPVVGVNTLHDPPEDILDPQESGYFQGIGMFIDFLLSPRLYYSPIDENPYPLPKDKCLLQVVGYVKERHPEFPLYLLEHHLKIAPGCPIQSRQWFIHE